MSTPPEKCRLFSYQAARCFILRSRSRRRVVVTVLRPPGISVRPFRRLFAVRPSVAGRYRCNRKQNHRDRPRATVLPSQAPHSRASWGARNRTVPSVHGTLHAGARNQRWRHRLFRVRDLEPQPRGWWTTVFAWSVSSPNAESGLGDAIFPSVAEEIERRQGSGNSIRQTHCNQPSEEFEQRSHPEVKPSQV